MPVGDYVAGEARVKYYGMMYITRRTYVAIQSVVFVLTVLFFFLSLLWTPTGPFANFFFTNLEWFFLLVLVLEIVEAAIMIRKFRDAEARRGASGPKPF